MTSLTLATLTLMVLPAGGAQAQAPTSHAYGGVVPPVANVPPVPPAAVTPPGTVTPSGGAPTAAGSTPVPGTAGSAPENAGTAPENNGTLPENAAAPQQAVKAAAAQSAPTGKGVLSTTGRSLPFTGLDVLLMLAGGGVLLAVGIGLRRLARSPG